MRDADDVRTDRTLPPASRLAAPDLAAGRLAGLPRSMALPAAAPDLQSQDDAPLLLAVADAPCEAPGTLRDRLLRRVAASAADTRRMHTRRFADTVATVLAPGVTQRTLYQAEAGRPRRAGEPDAVALIELAPGAQWNRPARQQQQACLVLRGRVRIGAQVLREHDHRVWSADPAVADAARSLPGAEKRPPSHGSAAAFQAGAHGALLLWRESTAPDPGRDPAQPATSRARGAPWEDYGPGIRRRLLWQQGGEAAMLYHALPGAFVPPHGHRHDEECLMLAGDFFLDDVLLRPLDYQIAPAGTGHHTSRTDTGVVIYAHGDLQLDLR
jgi:quercetin dioxygenase-like cupin family protein